jgi:hypothetical protein
MEELKQYLIDNPQNETVWVDSEGNWYFTAKEGCTEKTRDEIIQEKAEKKTANKNN